MGFDRLIITFFIFRLYIFARKQKVLNVVVLVFVVICHWYVRMQSNDFLFLAARRLKVENNS